MPVIPEHVPPFQIKAPTTSGDEGRPSASLWADAQRVFEFVDDERHLVAERLYLDVKQRLTECEQQLRIATKGGMRVSGFKIGHHSSKKAKHEHEKLIHEAARVKSLFAQNEEVLSRLLRRCRLFRNAKQNLSTDEDWTYACHHFGITTYYRREADGSLSVKLDGELKDVPLFEQICVLKEIDLHYRWAPFCSSSMTIADLDKIDTVGWFLIGSPSLGLARDGCFRAVGCDCLEEHGTILLAAQGIQDRKPGSSPPEDTCLSDDPIIEKLDIPPVPTRRGSGRMTIKKFEAMVTITSPTSVNTRIVANVDPNLPFLPQSLLEFAMKHMAGVLLAKLQGAAKKASKNPINNEHAKRMRTEKAFYKVWLMTKFRSLCYQKGWEMPHVTAFDYTEKDSRLYHRAVTFNGTVTEASVLEGLSAATEQEAHASGGDSISELSGITSLRSKNRLVAYLHEMEERTRQKKEEKIAAMRSMAAARLKPKEIDPSKVERLNQLKTAKARISSSKVTFTIAQEGDDASYRTAMQEPSLRDRATGVLHSHPIWFRVTFMLSLLLLQFSLLNFGIIHVTNEAIFRSRVVWGFLLLDDVAVFALMLICCFVDYLICFVAFIYTFSSLELGAKTGFRIKKYYADKVALFVGTKSVGILGIAVIKAWLKVMARLLSTFGLRLWTDPQQVLLAPLMGFFRSLRWLRVPTNSKGSLSELSVPNEEYTETYLNSISGFLHSSVVHLARTTINYLSSYGIVSEANVQINTFRGVESDSSKISSSPWLDEAFETARILFTYSSVFLLTFLVLFSLTAMTSRPEKSEKHARAVCFRSHTSSVSELSEDKETNMTPFGDRADESIDGDRATPPLSLSTPASSALSSRRRRYRPFFGRFRRGERAETAGQPWPILHSSNLSVTS